MAVRVVAALVLNLGQPYAPRVCRKEGNVYLLFELIDYTHDDFKNMPDGGWHRIAWGFLKLVSKNQGKPKVRCCHDHLPALATWTLLSSFSSSVELFPYPKTHLCRHCRPTSTKRCPCSYLSTRKRTQIHQSDEKSSARLHPGSWRTSRNSCLGSQRHIRRRCESK